MVCFKINFDNFNKDFYDERFYIYQIKEWTKNLNYVNKKNLKIKDDDKKKIYIEELHKSEKQIQIYKFLIETIYDKKNKNIEQINNNLLILKIKNFVNSQ